MNLYGGSSLKSYRAVILTWQIELILMILSLNNLNLTLVVALVNLAEVV